MNVCVCGCVYMCVCVCVYMCVVCMCMFCVCVCVHVCRLKIHSTFLLLTLISTFITICEIHFAASSTIEAREKYNKSEKE